MKKLIPLLLVIFGLFIFQTVNAQTTKKRVILQGFWWDYTNNNYNNSWANYLTELAPRLKAMGIDAVWIPPIYKNPSPNSVGYSPFDHYDLGDKFQKGSTTTRVGTKDEVLRMIAVLHANGIEVISDIVLNHVDGAGTNSGAGGQDPEPNYSMASNSGFKNFRYVSYSTPAPIFGQATAQQYWSRNGRWAKNYPNFHPNTGTNQQNTDWTEPFWGPDLSYGLLEDGTSNGFGVSSNANCATCYNPPQAFNYNRNQARNWFKWFVKQTGVDGFRWDAVKHYPHFIAQDLSYNVKYLNGWANLGESMLNFGEYVGGGATLDAYVNDVANSNGGSDKLMGTMDFGLRGAFYNIITGNGSYDISQVPAAQQTERVTYYGNSNTYVHLTIPFVNNHDTYRPIVNSSGNITGWNTGSELAPHIDPSEPRLSVIYALNFALDGNPLIFFEDLFNVSTTGKRFSHLPTSTTDLPQNSAIENLIWCHQALDFKSGSYKVRGHSGNTGDHLIVERSGKAIIGANDSWTNWQSDWVDSDFPPGTVLKDYGGSANSTTTVQNDQRVLISTPPCNGTETRRGYSVWAPVGQDGNTYTPPRDARTSQEWEMADDLGDSHCSSLGQGGRLPDNSIGLRTVGKVFSEANQKIDLEVYGENSANSITLMVYNLNGDLLLEESGVAPIVADYTTTDTDWYIIKIRNTDSTYAGQKAWVKAVYTAPAVVNTSQYPTTLRRSIWQGTYNTDWDDCRNWEQGLKPSSNRDALILGIAQHMPVLNANRFCHNLTIQDGASLTIAGTSNFTITGDIYNNGNGLLYNGDSNTVVLKQNAVDTATQYIYGNVSFSHLQVDNDKNIILGGDVEVSNALTFVNGKIELNTNVMTLGEDIAINGASDNRYIITDNENIATSYVISTVSSQNITIPIGTPTTYAPMILQNESGIGQMRTRVFEGVYENGNLGLFVSSIDSMVNLTWEMQRESGASQIQVTTQWNSDQEKSAFTRANASLMLFNNNQWGGLETIQNIDNAPYQVTSSNYLENYQYFAVVDSQIYLLDNYTPIDPPNNSDTISVKIYPNPTGSVVTLEVDGNFNRQNDELNVNVYSIDGKLAFNSSGLLEKINADMNIYFTRLHRGVYIFDIEIKGEHYRMKVLKE